MPPFCMPRVFGAGPPEVIPALRPGRRWARPGKRLARRAGGFQVPVSASRQLRYCYRFGRAQNALICVPTVDECTITAGAHIGGDARGPEELGW